VLTTVGATALVVTPRLDVAQADTADERQRRDEID
jgi:hypothetical protein